MPEPLWGCPGWENGLLLPSLRALWFCMGRAGRAAGLGKVGLFHAMLVRSDVLLLILQS